MVTLDVFDIELNIAYMQVRQDYIMLRLGTIGKYWDHNLKAKTIVLFNKRTMAKTYSVKNNILGSLQS